MNATADTTVELTVRGLSVTYDAQPALRQVDLSCRGGELVGVVGPNGAGKSTLLKAIVGIVRADAGEVRVDDRRADRALADLAYVPQRSEVDWDFPATVADVVAMGRRPHLGRLRRPRRDDRALVAAALERVSMTALRDRPIGALSAGQRQRAFLARALAQQARVLLLDEPFAGVDAVTERLLWDELTRLRQDGAAVVVVHHDLTGVGEHADRLVLLARRVVADGPPEQVCSPATLLEAYGGLPAASGAREQ